MLRRAPRIAVLVIAVIAAVSVCAQTENESATASPSELLPETQKQLHSKDYTGMVWWIPVEFWERAFVENGSTTAKAAEQVKPLRDYVMVATVIGKLGPFGAIAFVPGEQLRAKTALRDAKGVSYFPLPEVSSDAETLAAVLKPVFANVLGKTGESMEVLFFPARDSSGKALADPRQKGSFTIVIQDVAGKPDPVFEWQLPLTALASAKFCPVGKERVQANWNYCPWHGVSLNEPAAPARATPSAK